MKTSLAILATAACTALLAGCSSEPSASDIEKAVQASVAQSQQAMQQMASNNPQAADLAKSLSVKVHEAKKIGCKADGDKAYLCDVEMDIETGMTGRVKKTVPLRMVKGSDGWTPSGM